MGDRNNPIKFGPEWLRNMAREHTEAGDRNAGAGSSGGQSPASSPPAPPPLNSNSPQANPTTGTSKILLAKLRYGREELLALYDDTAEAPPELKQIDGLYQSRGKAPCALNNTFEEETRDNMRSAPPIGSMSPAERFNSVRAATRGMSDVRVKTRGTFIRQVSTGRGSSGWHAGARMPIFNTGTDDTNPVRSWTNNNTQPNTPNRSSGEPDWSPKVFRNKRQGNSTNWRQQQSREEGEEWRGEPGRHRDRDWGERNQPDKLPSWSSNRRTWVGGDSQNNDDLPEWAVENAEACGGTFDSAGAFHGYSHDDSNIPKNQESAHPLARSHTHGSFARSKAVEEGFEEAPDKAKKLSTSKKFDQSSAGGPEKSNNEGDNKSAIGSDLQYVPEKLSEAASGPPEPAENKTSEPKEEKIAKKDNNTPFKSKQKFTESNMFDAMMRSDINMEETTDDRGNFQSVMINPNNSLRQKHQNIVSPGSENANRPSRKSDVMQMGPNLADIEPPPAPTMKSPEDIVDDMFDLTLESKDMLLQKLPLPSNISNTGMAPGLSQPGNPMSQMSPMSNLGLRMASPGLGANHSMVMNSLANTTNMPPPIIQSHAMQSNVMQSVGITNSALNASLGLSLGPNLMSIQSIRPPNIPSSSIGMQPGLHTGLQSSLQSGLQPGLQSTLQSLQSQSAMHHNMPPPNMPPNMQSNLQSSLQSTMQSTLQLNIHPNMQNNMQSLQGGMPSSMQSNMPPHMQSHMQQSHVQPNMLSNMQPNMQSNMPPNMQPNMQSNMQQSHVQPNMQSNMPPNMQPIMQPIQSGLQGGPSGMPSFQSAGNLQGMPNSVGNSSLFLTQNSNNNENIQMPNLSDIPMPNHRAVGQGSIFPSHGLHSGAPPFGSSMYGNIMQQNPGAGPSGPTNLADQWYYEDPKKTIQGPFSSKDMFNWYRAGFFCPSLMVRRACDAIMRPLGSYGPVVPFAQMDMLPPFPMAGGFEPRSQPSHDNMLNSQQSMGLDVRHLPPMANASSMEPIQFGSVRLLRSPPYGLPSPMVDSLWAQPPPSNELMWMQQAMNTQQRNENRVNNLPVFFWDQQPSAITSNSLLPEEIAKEMKTEDQILAQLRASQNVNTSQSVPFLDKTSTVPPANPETDYQPSTTSATPNLEELHKLIQKDTLIKTETVDETSDDGEPQTRIKTDKSSSSNVQAASDSATVKQANQQNKPTEAKPAKKSDNVDKSAKNKENNNTKNKNRKAKEDKKDEVPEVKLKDEEVKAEKRSKESSPSKSKKEEKVNKKDLEKEKKEWIKEGFTIVKGSEKTSSKENKKKTDDVKVAEESERKRKEEEKLAADDDKKKKQADDVIKKQQEMHPQQQPRPMVVESVVKKAPWSVGANHAMQASTRDGPTLAEIQRLEREKKLEQMKEQQHMMHIIAQQHAAAMAREQEMQAGLGWAKKKMQGVTPPGQSLAEIQAEARKQAVAAAMVAASQQQLEELQSAPPPLANHVPWGTTHNGAFRPIGFWDNPANQPKAEKEVATKMAEQKPKKKPIAAPIPPAVAGASGMCSAAAKKEDSPTLEFEEWCTTVLTLWSSTIDVPTFIAFLKDIESPYEVKDYVKCYLGEAKDANDFARQFLERRSKLLRVGMDTPSDDLCSPAMAVNPRTLSNSDYQEVKGKGKKTKKNKMMKVDANILGFSVTASEDRINVGDIDTA